MEEEGWMSLHPVTSAEQLKVHLHAQSPYSRKWLPRRGGDLKDSQLKALLLQERVLHTYRSGDDPDSSVPAEGAAGKGVPGVSQGAN